MPKFNMYDGQANLNFVRNQASHIEPSVYETKYAEIQYASIVPVDTSAPDFSQSVTYVSTDARGAAQWINGGRGGDVPVVSTSRNETTTAVHTAAIGYDYGFEEIGLARQLGINLTSDKARAANRISEEMIESVALDGDASKGFYGIYNNPNVTVVPAPDGVGGNSAWTTKTSLEILKDVNDCVSGIWTETKEIELSDTILLPPENLAYIATTPMSADNNKTILKFLQETNMYTMQTGKPLTFKTLRKLKTAGSGSVARMVAYNRNPDVVKLHMPMPHQFLEAQVVQLMVVVPGVFRLGGTDIRRPGAVRYYDGI